jgi:hypothetical protein
VRIWAGFVGPGVRSGGNDGTWVDHTDLRPTILRLTGLQDDYALDGAVIAGILDTKAVPQTLRAHRATLGRLAGIYKQINAPLGRFGLDVIAISDAAVRSSDESRYAALESAIQSLAAERDAIAGDMRSLLEQATFGGGAIDEQQAKALIRRAEALLARADSTASSA